MPRVHHVLQKFTHEQRCTQLSTQALYAAGGSEGQRLMQAVSEPPGQPEGTGGGVLGAGVGVGVGGGAGVGAGRLARCDFHAWPHGLDGEPS